MRPVNSIIICIRESNVYASALAANDRPFRTRLLLSVAQACDSRRIYSRWPLYEFGTFRKRKSGDTVGNGPNNRQLGVQVHAHRDRLNTLASWRVDSIGYVLVVRPGSHAHPEVLLTHSGRRKNNHQGNLRVGMRTRDVLPVVLRHCGTSHTNQFADPLKDAWD